MMLSVPVNIDIMVALKKDKVDFIIETSWEVCNKIGGIYTVLSSKAKTMLEVYNENILFVGPDIWQNTVNPWFEESSKVFPEWKKYASGNENLKIRTGYWLVPGKPKVVLVDFQQFYADRNEIYRKMWDDFKVDSLHGYGDYDESCMFAYATGVVIESFYKFYKFDKKNVIAHFNEWMLGMGALYIRKHLPQVATVFTTHATSIGRSIAGNNKPLYDYLTSYNGDQMAQELNIVAKHSIEKQTAKNVDCFTTVSQITAQECKYLLECEAEITPNGFEKDFVPTGNKYKQKQAKARNILINVAEMLYGVQVDKDALIVATSGRYEYKNKGLDVFIDSLGCLNQMEQLNKDLLAFIMVPAWMKEARTDLKERLNSNKSYDVPLDYPYLTHWLNDMDNDPIVNKMKSIGLDKAQLGRVKIIFVPSYLNGSDGIFNIDYYDLLIGMDATVFASYYEPWGYTPHESIAFSVPTITTTLAGFGLWMKEMGDTLGMGDGAEVIGRNDSNYNEAAKEICGKLFEVTLKNKKQITAMKKAASERAALADWQHFFIYYQEAYRKALHNARNRF